MKTTLELPDALLEELRLRAIRDGRMLDDAVADLIRKGLGVFDSPPVAAPRLAIERHPQTGLPYIDCPSEAPARRMTTVELLALEHNTLAAEDRERLALASRQ